VEGGYVLYWRTLIVEDLVNLLNSALSSEMDASFIAATVSSVECLRLRVVSMTRGFFLVDPLDAEVATVFFVEVARFRGRGRGSGYSASSSPVPSSGPSSDDSPFSLLSAPSSRSSPLDSARLRF
jgi:hypothetical protein